MFRWALVCVGTTANWEIMLQQNFEANERETGKFARVSKDEMNKKAILCARATARPYDRPGLRRRALRARRERGAAMADRARRMAGAAEETGRSDAEVAAAWALAAPTAPAPGDGALVSLVYRSTGCRCVTCRAARPEGRSATRSSATRGRTR